MPNPIARRRTSALDSYARRVLRMRPGSLVGYWPMSETAGTVAFDLSFQGNNGAYTGVDLGAQGMGDGRVCPWLDGTNDFNDIYSAALNSDFNTAEGTLMIWAKLNSADVWADGLSRVFIRLMTNGNNLTQISLSAGANSLSWYFYAGAGANNLSITQGGVSSLDWMCLALTYSVSANEFKVYLNGVQQGSTATGLGTWVGALAATTTLIGASITTPTRVHHGWLAHAAVWNVPLSQGEIAYLGRAR